MGANMAKSDTTVLNAVLQKTISKVLSSTVSNTQTVDKLVQKVYIDNANGNIECDGPLSINQRGQVTAQALGTLFNTNQSSMLSDMATKIKSALDDKMRQLNSGLNPLQANISQAAATLSDRVTTDLETKIQNSVQSLIHADGQGSQIIRLDNAHGKMVIHGSCTFDQTLVLSQVVKNLANSMESDVMTYKATADLAEKYKLTQTQANEGLSFGMILLLIAAAAAIAFFVWYKFSASWLTYYKEHPTKAVCLALGVIALVIGLVVLGCYLIKKYL